VSGSGLAVSVTAASSYVRGVVARNRGSMAVRMSDAYDVVVIGSGTGGYSCALRAAQLGKRVAIVERDERLGGTCLLRGCIPTKALLQSAAVMDTVNRSEEWGIKASGEPDWTQVQAFETKIVDKLVSGLTGLVKARRIDVIRGSAALLRDGKVDVEGRGLDAQDVVIATGSKPRLLPGLEISSRVITSDEALWYPEIPTSAVIIGAGAIGLEMASAFSDLGAEVTVIGQEPEILPALDADVAAYVRAGLEARGVRFERGASVTAVEVAPHRARLVEQAVAGMPVEVVCADGREVGSHESLPEGGFDRVLVDAPCTGLGSLRRRPESRWRRQPSDLPPLTRLQRELLAAAIRAVRPGGVVGYVTCSPHPVETRVTVSETIRRMRSTVELLDARAVLPADLPDLGDGPTVQLWPHRHGTDAMFLALLRVESEI